MQTSHNYDEDATLPQQTVSTKMHRIVACVGLLAAWSAGAALAQDMPLSQVLLPGEDWRLVAEGYQFTEGPAVDAAGRLFFTDVPAGTIFRLDDAGQPQVFAEGLAGPAGLMFGPDGRLYATLYSGRQIVALAPDGSVEVLAGDVGCNDLVVAGDGGIYFTDPGSQGVQYLSPERELRLVAEGIESPNGIILWPTQGTLVVSDSAGDRLWTYRILEDGSLADREGYYQLELPAGVKASSADGMTVDRSGRLFATSNVGLQMFDPSGRLSGVIRKPQSAFLSNVVLGGPNFDVLYVTCQDKVYARRTQTQGLLYFAPPGE